MAPFPSSPFGSNGSSTPHHASPDPLSGSSEASFASSRLALILAVLASALLAITSSASATTVDLVDGNGTLTWDTSVSVGSVSDNTSVTHPLFPTNRHPREGWFIYLPAVGLLHEFTNFTKTVDGASQDVLTSSYTTFFNETFVLDLTYGINAVGPDGLPDLAWSGSLSRPLGMAFAPLFEVRLFNVFDYDVGNVLGADSASVSFPTNATLIEIQGDGGISGQRGAYMSGGYTADTLTNVLNQIQTVHTLNNIAAPGSYDVAGAFEWYFNLCITGDPMCTGTGGGTGGMGGFGGFGAQVPEPSTAVLLLGGLCILASRRRSADGEH